MNANRRIFATLDDFVPPGGGPVMVGRNMANHYFFSALMRYGTFDEYHFFLSNRAHRNLFREKHAKYLEMPEVAKKVRLFDRLDLPEHMRKYDYTVMHLADHVTHMASLARLRNELQVRVPISAFIHSLSYPAHMGKYLELLFSGLSAGDTIVCSSECGKKVVESCLKNVSMQNGPVSRVNLSVIPLGIDEPPGCMDRALARRQLGYRNDEVVGLCFGRFSDFDKMDLFPLLQAFRTIQGDRNRMVLAGAVHDAEYYQILQLWVRALGLAKRVEFVVEPNNEKKLALFSAADFFVSIADNPQETFGLTVLEAMHAGIPVVVSDYDGYRELAGDEAGIRVPTLWTQMDGIGAVESVMDMRTLHRYMAQATSIDMPALKDALRQMYTDAQLRAALGQQARERFLRLFSHRDIIARLEKLWLSGKLQFSLNDAPLPPMKMDLFHTFSHYVTGLLSAEDVVSATDFSRELLRANVDYPLLPNMSDLVDQARAKTIVTHCLEQKDIASLLQEFGDSWRTRFLLMWMLKHDLIEIISTVR